MLNYKKALRGIFTFVGVLSFIFLASSVKAKDIYITASSTDKVILAGQLCFTSDCKSAWSQVTGVSYWSLNGSNLYASSTSYNVGIGTTNPIMRLESVGTYGWPATNGTAQSGSLRLKSPDSGVGLDFGFGDSSPFPAWIQAVAPTNLAGTFPLVINPRGGNVGIGTTNPGYKLEVSGSEYITNGFGNPNNESSYRLKFYDNGGIYNDTGIGLDGAAAGEKMWFNALNGFYFNYGTSGAKITFNPSGSVGIGTTNPGYVLDVSGGMRATSLVTFPQFTGNGNKTVMADNSGNLYVAAQAPGLWSGTYNGAIRNGDTGDGNVGIGKYDPKAKLQVRTNSSADYVDLLATESIAGRYNGDYGHDTYGGRFVALGSSARNAYGIYGEASVLNYNGDVYGVYGSSTDIGVRGVSSGGSDGVQGYSSGGTGVSGQSVDGYGIYAYSQNSLGLYAGSTNDNGINAYSDNGNAIYGNSQNGDAIYGYSDSNTGISGGSSSGYGLYGGSNSNSGLYAYSNTAPAIWAYSNSGPAAVFENGNVGIGITNPSSKLDIVGPSGVGSRNLMRLMLDGGYGVTSFNQFYASISNYGLDINSGQFVINKGSGGVGIGTTAPGSYKLNVQGGQVNASGGLCIAGDCKTAWNQVTGASYWALSGSNLYASSTTYNVGIGTTVPAGKLDVVTAQQSEFFGTDNGTPAVNLLIRSTATSKAPGTGSSLVFTAPANTDGSNEWGIARILGTPDNANTSDANGALYLQTRANYNPGVGGSWNWRTGLIIRSSGNVGIGTTNPGAQLHVISSLSGANSGEQYGSVLTTSYNTANSGLKQGLRLNTASGNNTGTISTLVGLVNLVSNNGSGGTTNSSIAYWSRVDAGTVRTVNNAYNFYVNDASIGSGSSITNQYGLYVDPLSGATNNYAVYTAGTTKSSFGGKVGIGTTAPGDDLDIYSASDHQLTIRKEGASSLTLHSGGLPAIIWKNNTSLYFGTKTSDNGLANWNPLMQLSTGGVLSVTGGFQFPDNTVQVSAAKVNSGSFTVGGSSSNYYPVRFTPSVLAALSGSASNDLIIFRDATHENCPNSTSCWYGTFSAKISFHPKVWGNFNDSIEKIQYQLGTGAPYNDPLGDIADGSESANSGELVVWLKGGATYHWRNTDTTAGWSLTDGNSGGTTLTDISGISRAPISSQSQNIVNAKNKLSLVALGLNVDQNAIFNGSVGIGTSSPGSYKLSVSGDIGATSFQYNSDRSLKKNIETIKDPLNKILQLRGVTFNWKKDDKASVGVIAQEVEKVFPELVTESNGIKSVGYGNLVGPLIEAVKVQQKEINNLEARINILEKKK